MLTSDQLVEHMKNKGILFTIITEEKAKKHLSHHNNFFKLTLYRKNYAKITTGKNAGKYIRLEFAYLIELARIDTEIRHLLLDMTLDIEHFLKVMLLTKVEDQLEYGEDGYKIISDYLFDVDNQHIGERTGNTSKRSSNFHHKILRNKKNPYCNGLITKYANDMPIWAYVELISFGDLLDLIAYYAEKIKWELPVDINSLDRVRQIRNACAHGNAIINDLFSTSTKESSNAPEFITQFLTTAGIGSESRKKKLGNPRINQIVHLLYIYHRVVVSEHTRGLRIEELKRLINVRIPEHADYFKSNNLLTSTYEFFKKIASNFF